MHARHSPASHLARPLQARRPRAQPLAAAAVAPALHVWDGSAALIAFVVAAGGWVHPSLVVATPAGGVRGLFVTADVRAGTPLAYVPPSVCLRPGDAPVPLSLCDSPADRVAVALLLRLRAGRGDTYTASLPPPHELLPCFPRAWTAEQRSKLAHPRFEAALAQQRAGSEALLTGLVAACAGDGLPAPTLDELLWAQACVHTRSYGHGTGESACSAEPLLDCVNHAPFSHFLSCDADEPTHNVLHTYVPAGTALTRATALGLSNLPAACAAAGCAALLTLRPLLAGEEVLNSYAGAVTGGQLSCAGALTTFGFVPGPPGSLPADTRDADGASAARERLVNAVNAADAALGPTASAEQLLQSALAVFAHGIGASALADSAEAREGSDEPARLAAQYRLHRSLALGREAMGKLQPEAVAGEGLRAGLESSIPTDQRLRERVWQALAGETKPLMKPAQAYASLRVSAQLN
jgi:hypothetical protein